MQTRTGRHEQRGGGQLTTTTVNGGRIVRFRADAPTIPAARRWVSEVARRAGASADAERVVALLTTEAITNAVVHGPPHGVVDVEAMVRGDRVHVDVSDESTRPPVLRRPEVTDLTGRGVMLIDTLASAWGVELHRASKTVWFEVAF